MVLSIIAYSLLPSAARCSKTRSHTPALAQRLNRRCVFFQSPKRSGRSRHGIPARYLYSTASTKRRLSRAGHRGVRSGAWPPASNAIMERLRMPADAPPGGRGLRAARGRGAALRPDAPEALWPPDRVDLMHLVGFG